MAQLIQAKTEVDCLLEDLKASESMSGTQRGSLEKEIDTIKRDIREKEVELMELDPLWEESRLKEARERQEYVYLSSLLIMGQGSDISG